MMFNAVNLKKPRQRKISKHGESLKGFGLMIDYSESDNILILHIYFKW